MNIPQIKNRQGGFTLIELIVVMVILGILAAFAIPRFANLTGEARAATVNGAKASMQSAATIVRAKWLASGGGGDAVEVDGADVTQNNGYPTADAAGICAAIRSNEKIACGTDGGNVYVGYKTDVGQADNAAIAATTCRVQYALVIADGLAVDTNIAGDVDGDDCR